MTHTIKMFLKIGSQENIKDLYENGTIYMNTLQYFRQIEDNELRGDSYEGASEVINSLPGTFRIPGVDRDFEYEKIHLKKSYEEVRGNIFSLYCISSKGFPNPLDFKIDERIFRFGTHCLMIKNNKYFFERIVDELKKSGQKFNHSFVDYYEKETVCKELTIFDKPTEFEYQKEFRFFVDNDKLEPIKLQIGSLKEYAEILESEQLSKMTLEIRKN